MFFGNALLQAISEIIKENLKDLQKNLFGMQKQNLIVKTRLE